MSLEVSASALNASPQKNKRRRSASQLKQFRTCGELFRLVRLERVPQQESAASVQGSAFHEAADIWERSGRQANPVAEFTLSYGRSITELDRKVPRRNWRVWGRGLDVEKDIQNRLLVGQEMIEQYTDLMMTVDQKPILLPDDSPASEVHFEIDIGPCIIVGAIDVILDTKPIKVRDLKTGAKETTPIQLAVYALAARNVLGIDVWHGDFYYAKHSDIEEYDLSRFTDEYIIHEFEIMEETIEKRLLHPSPGGDCFTCPVKSYCKELGNR